MKINDVVIRLETKADYKIVENLVRESFWNVYRPGCSEHYVLHMMRDSADFVTELDFVMEKGGLIIGQNVFVKTKISLDSGETLPIMTMGPISIANDYKRQGYGKLLLDYSLEKAKELGCKAVCFEGNILFYGKSGFVTAASKGIRYHGMPDADFFLCKELCPGYLNDISGEYVTPECYFAAEENPEDFELFDSAFPKAEKLVLPGQLLIK